MPDITEIVAGMAERLAVLETRVANMIVEGTVEEVKPAEQLVRLRIGGTDDKPQLSGWMPYAQSAGDMKWHTPPSVGQQMTAISKDGVPEKAVALPMTWSNDNPSPSTKGDEDVYTRGDLKETRRGDEYKIELGSTSITMTKDALVLRGPIIRENL